MMKRLIPFALALGLSACGSASSSTTPSNTTSSGLTTDTFTGTVAVGGSDSKNFTVVLTGVVSVTLTAAPVPLGLAVGIPGSSGCGSLIPGSQVTATAGSLAQVAGEVTPGTFCVLVSDVGNLTAPAAYSLSVQHP